MLKKCESVRIIHYLGNVKYLYTFILHTFLVEKHLGSGKKLGFGIDDGAEKLDCIAFLGVSSPILAWQMSKKFQKNRYRQKMKKRAENVNLKTKINIYARSFRKNNRAQKSRAKYPMYYTDLILDFEKKIFNR